jgi:hypothetical protein
MRFYISTPLFYLILILILLLPLSHNAKLLLFGKRVVGTVVEYDMIKGNARNDRMPGISNISIVSFKANGKQYKTYSSLNAVFDIGEQITVIYKEDDPQENILLTFSSLYTGYGLVLTGFVLMVWMAFYLTYGSRKRKPPMNFTQKIYKQLGE